MTKLVIAEKNTVSQNIVCALAKIQLSLKECSKCSSKKGCAFLRTDTFVTIDNRFARSECDLEQLRCLVDRGKKRPPYFKCAKKDLGKDANHCHFSFLYSSALVERPPMILNIRIQRFLKALRRSGFNGYRENIRYYLLPMDNPTYVVMDTQGTMMDLGYIGKGYRQLVNLERDVLSATPVEEILRNLKYVPNRSHVVRSFLFRAVLDEKIFGEITEIFVSTDVDVAGSYIALSILEKSERESKTPISSRSIRRVNLQKMSAKEIVKAFEKSSDFDWGNAYAGKLRAIFDYTFGILVSHKMNQAIKAIQKRGPHLGIGRVQTPTLRLLIERNGEIENEPWKYVLYFVSPGCANTRELIDQLLTKDAACFLVRLRSKGVGEADLVNMLSKNQIGTHTTRPEQHTKLATAGLVSCEKTLVLPTEFGKSCERILSRELDNQKSEMSLTSINKDINQRFEEFGRVTSETEARKLLENALRQYLGQIGLLSARIEARCKYIAGDLVRDMDAEQIGKIATMIASDEEQRAETLAGKSPGKTSPQEITNEIHLDCDELLPEWSIDKLLNLYKADPEKTIIIERTMLEEDFLEKQLHELRMALAIPYGTEFEVLNYFPEKTNPSLFAVHNIDRDVFVGRLGETVVESILKSEVTMEEFLQALSESMSSEVTEKVVNEITKEEKAQYTHDPAHGCLRVANSIEPSMIPGPDGVALLKEIANALKRVWKRQRGKKTLLEFGIRDLKFARAEYHSTSKAHSYESILRLMGEKYGWPLKHTSDLLEKMYLGR